MTKKTQHRSPARGIKAVKAITDEVQSFTSAVRDTPAEQNIKFTEPWKGSQLPVTLTPVGSLASCQQFDLQAYLDAELAKQTAAES